jgi:hypothetical protein
LVRRFGLAAASLPGSAGVVSVSVGFIVRFVVVDPVHAEGRLRVVYRDFNG